MILRTDMFIGFGVLFVSAIIIHLILINAFSRKNDESGPSKRITAGKVNSLFIRAVYPVLVGGFVIAMLWTGYTPQPDDKVPQGSLDQKSEPGRIDYQKGSNSPEEASKTLDKEIEIDQPKSTEDLRKFRKEKLKTDAITEESEKGESK